MRQVTKIVFVFFSSFCDFFVVLFQDIMFFVLICVIFSSRPKYYHRQAYKQINFSPVTYKLDQIIHDSYVVLEYLANMLLSPTLQSYTYYNYISGLPFGTNLSNFGTQHILHWGGLKTTTLTFIILDLNSNSSVIVIHRINIEFNTNCFKSVIRYVGMSSDKG